MDGGKKPAITTRGKTVRIVRNKYFRDGEMQIVSAKKTVRTLSMDNSQEEGERDGIR